MHLAPTSRRAPDKIENSTKLPGHRRSSSSSSCSQDPSSKLPMVVNEEDEPAVLIPLLLMMDDWKSSFSDSSSSFRMRLGSSRRGLRAGSTSVSGLVMVLMGEKVIMSKYSAEVPR